MSRSAQINFLHDLPDFGTLVDFVAFSAIARHPPAHNLLYFHSSIPPKGQVDLFELCHVRCRYTVPFEKISSDSDTCDLLHCTIRIVIDTSVPVTSYLFACSSIAIVILRNCRRNAEQCFAKLCRLVLYSDQRRIIELRHRVLYKTHIFFYKFGNSATQTLLSRTIYLSITFRRDESHVKQNHLSARLVPHS
ncbi:unnamed protein product [Albugo candida]|uniref:Uncharacterized protein n=1 Tax=Albugo candida TaxID=65357 RepID=A0A024GBE8_9STRA|nr:unnamed protein product [Albugo candida]|eukprot:CCI43662.1 unnamed protein product [Albugo candida]